MIKTKRLAIQTIILNTALMLCSFGANAADVCPNADTIKEYNPVSLSAREEMYIDSALGLMKMDRDSTGFKKDKVDDNYRLARVQKSLYKPLELPAQCDKLDKQWSKTKTIADAFKIQAQQIDDWWAIKNSFDKDTAFADIKKIKIPKEIQLKEVLDPLIKAIYLSQALTDKAFASLSLNERKYISKKILPNLILAIDSVYDDFQVDAYNVDLRLAGNDTIPKKQNRDVIFPEDLKVLELTTKVKYGYLNQAGVVLATAIDIAIAKLKKMDLSKLKTFKSKDEAVLGNILYIAQTSLGKIIIGGNDNNTYQKNALLVIDIGGNDVYLNRAGGAVGLEKSAVSVLIDMAGDDFYSSHYKFSQGGGHFGIGILADMGGNDIYKAKHFAQGSALFGIGILWDVDSNNDNYYGDTFCQGAGGWGIGLLFNGAGATVYYAHTYAQGAGLVLGIGTLIDGSGNDNYIAAGTLQNNRLYSLSQGFGMGNRPIASGGIGVLIDYKGDDRYNCVFYGQGCAYWYGMGILIDNEGTDRYDAQVYAQGCGIHLSTGVLIERGGNDFYNCTYGGNAQGAAHDLSVGIMIEKGGNDSYSGRGNNQGSAITNAFALLIDSSGDDVYYTTPKGGQGIGGEARGYGSIGVFLDLGGNDFYSEESLNPNCDTRNNNKWIKGTKGCGIDTDK